MPCHRYISIRLSLQPPFPSLYPFQPLPSNQIRPIIPTTAHSIFKFQTMCLSHFETCPSGHKVHVHDITCDTFRGTCDSSHTSTADFTVFECSHHRATLSRSAPRSCGKCVDSTQQKDNDALRTAKTNAMVQLAPLRTQSEIMKRNADNLREAKAKAMKQTEHVRFLSKLGKELSE